MLYPPPCSSATADASVPAPLPIHFLTIVLNGEPFIRHHLPVFRQLPVRWHWHVVEGVAELVKDTAWSLAHGGAIPAGLHDHGLSRDGTTATLDRLAAAFPEQITLYRPPPGQFWPGKTAMVQAPLAHIREEALLWQVDADELWRVDQILRLHRMFQAAPERTAAYFLCRYFVGEDRVISSLDTYGNFRSYEWLRVWRMQPGDFWHSHEPPRLARPTADGTLTNIAALAPFTHEETAAAGLIFDHYAYVLEEHARFKESYYGYAGAVRQWRALQEHKQFPVALRQFFGWVQDQPPHTAQVEPVTGRGLLPLAARDENGHWQFRATPLPGERLALPQDLPLEQPGPRSFRADARRPVAPRLGWLSAEEGDAIAVFLPPDAGHATLLLPGFLRALTRRFSIGRLTVFCANPEWLNGGPPLGGRIALPSVWPADDQALLRTIRERFRCQFRLAIAPLATASSADRLAAAMAATAAPLRIGWAEEETAPPSALTHQLFGGNPADPARQLQAVLALLGAEAADFALPPPPVATILPARAWLQDRGIPTGRGIVLLALHDSATPATTALAHRLAGEMRQPTVAISRASCDWERSLGLMTLAVAVIGDDPLLAQQATLMGCPVLWLERPEMPLPTPGAAPFFRFAESERVSADALSRGLLPAGFGRGEGPTPGWRG